MWNMRKEVLLLIITHINNGQFDTNLLEDERKLTMKYLQSNPKSYCIWEHRRWCLEQAGLTQEVKKKKKKEYQ